MSEASGSDNKTADSKTADNETAIKSIVTPTRLEYEVKATGAHAETLKPWNADPPPYPIRANPGLSPGGLFEA